MNEHEHAANDDTEPKLSQDEVAKKAYAIYEKEGRPQGHAEQNWSDAQVQLQHGSAARPAHRGEHENAHQGHQNHHAHMAADFRNRFWIALALTLPILVLSPMLQTLVGLREVLSRCRLTNVFLVTAKPVPQT